MTGGIGKVTCRTMLLHLGSTVVLLTFKNNVMLVSDCVAFFNS